jgi:hypothetical protein
MIMKRIIGTILIFIFAFYGHAYCQDFNVKQSVKNAEVAWKSIFAGKKLIAISKNFLGYTWSAREMQSFKCDIKKTDSIVNPYILTVKIVNVRWGDFEGYASAKIAYENAEPKSSSMNTTPVQEILLGTYNLENGKWIFAEGNVWMQFFMGVKDQNLNKHINIEQIKSIPAK